MYCNKCGKVFSETSKFCSNCGYPVSQDDLSNSASENQSVCDAVEDIKKKLIEIDNRKKPPIKRSDVIKSAINVVKGEVSALSLVFDDSFDKKRIEEKKQLILDYPLPTSPNALASFAKYINLEITSKKKEPDALTDVWKEKLKQIYLLAEAESSSTEEFAEIKKYHKDNKRRERHTAIREFVVLLIFPIIAAFILSIVFHWPLLMFVSILAAGWEVFLVLFVYDLLDAMIASIKEHSTKRQNIPKSLRVAAWYMLMPALAALIVSIVYHSVVFIWLTAVLFGVDAFFLLLFLCDIYNL